MAWLCRSGSAERRSSCRRSLRFQRCQRRAASPWHCGNIADAGMVLLRAEG
jgi:hypothetical protein